MRYAYIMEQVILSTEKGSIFGMSAGPAGGQPVVGIHGWSQRNGWHTWQPLMEPLAQAGYLVVCVDMPGWGRSRPWSNGPLSSQEGVKAILAILDGLMIDSAVIMGKSWGGGLALASALDHPTRVERLVLTAPAYRELDRLSKLRQPVLLAWAEDDPVIPYRYATHFVEAVSSIELVTYPTGGHSAGPKNAEDFAQRVVEFLGREDMRSSAER